MMIVFDYKLVCSLFVLWPDVPNSCCHLWKHMGAQTARGNPLSSSSLSLEFWIHASLFWEQHSVTQQENPSSTIVIKWHMELLSHSGTGWASQLGSRGAHSPPGPMHSPEHLSSWCWQCREGCRYFWDLTTGKAFHCPYNTSVIPEKGTQGGGI